MVKTRRSYKKKYSRKNNKSKNFRKSKRRHKKRGGNKPETNNFCSEENIKKFFKDNSIITGKQKFNTEQINFLFETLLKIEKLRVKIFNTNKFEEKTLIDICHSLDDKDIEKIKERVPKFKLVFNNLLNVSSGGQRRGGTTEIDPTLDRLGGIFMIGFCAFFSWLMGKYFINPRDRRCVYYDPPRARCLCSLSFF